MSWNLGEVCNTATYVCNINLLLYVFRSLSFTLTLTVSVLGGVKGCNIIFPICVFILFVFYLRKMASEKIVLFEDLNLFPCHATKKKKKIFLTAVMFENYYIDVRFEFIMQGQKVVNEVDAQVKLCSLDTCTTFFSPTKMAHCCVENLAEKLAFQIIYCCLLKPCLLPTPTLCNFVQCQ